jgi:signal transduction histidine kinase
MRLFTSLYLRIWMAITASLLLLSLLIATAWYISYKKDEDVFQDSKVYFYDASGQVALVTSADPVMTRDRTFELDLADTLTYQTNPFYLLDGTLEFNFSPKPLFLAKWLPQPWANSATFFILTLVTLTIVLALGAYPFVRRLTKRLQILQHSVESWGQGNLSVRTTIKGQDEVAVLGRHFNQAADRVSELMQAHKNLLAHASHELRTPIARIRLGLDLMEKSPSKKTKAEMTQSLSELDQLIEEILLASRLNSLPYQTNHIESLEHLNLKDLVAKECALFPNVTFSGSEAYILGVTKLLRRLIRNLLENAQRYAGASQKNTEVCLRASHSEQDMACLEVCDYGPGIPKDMQEKIFEPFFRVPHTLRQHTTGTGLGLSLVRGIVKYHRGYVICKHRPDGKSGACFKVYLPVVKTVYSNP